MRHGGAGTLPSSILRARDWASEWRNRWQGCRFRALSTFPAILPRCRATLVTLLAAGYHVEETHLVDLFPQTYHMETVLHLAR